MQWIVYDFWFAWNELKFNYIDLVGLTAFQIMGGSLALSYIQNNMLFLYSVNLFILCVYLMAIFWLNI